MPEKRCQEHRFAPWFNCPECCRRAYAPEDDTTGESTLAESVAWLSEARRGAAS
jgi:hypothetical protein